MNTKDQERAAALAHDLDGHLIDGCLRLDPIDKVPTYARVLMAEGRVCLCSTIGARYVFHRELGAFVVVPRLTLN